jgi:hypothetical protein
MKQLSINLISRIDFHDLGSNVEMLGFTWDEWNLQDQHQNEQKQQ